MGLACLDAAEAFVAVSTVAVGDGFSSGGHDSLETNRLLAGWLRPRL